MKDIVAELIYCAWRGSIDHPTAYSVIDKLSERWDERKAWKISTEDIDQDVLLVVQEVLGESV